MLIEIHMIQNHSPSNLNRDDLGAPKTCIFGGVMRNREASQCLKRSIRRSPLFQSLLEKEGGVRTRRLISVLAEKASYPQEPQKDLIDFVAKAFEHGGVSRTQKGEEPDNTNILLFVPRSAIEKMADAAKKAWEMKKAPDVLANELAIILGTFAAVPDIALCGRMTELDRSGLFAKINLTGEAALSVSHAISTHAVTNEVDYFTAVDDLGKGMATAHVDEAQFSSACLYKYFSLDWEQLVDNLHGPMPAKPKKPGKDATNDEKTAYSQYPQTYEAWQKARSDAEKLAAATLGHFILAATQTTPSGKQHSFAAFNEPCSILVEIKAAKTPTSYANAFAEPARKVGNAPDDAADCVSLLGRSIAQFGDHVYCMRRAYGSDSTLLWYSHQPWRYPLQGWDREDDGRKAKARGENGQLTEREKPPVQFASKRFDILGGNGQPGLIEAVIEELHLNLRWADVKDAGKAQDTEA